MKYRAALAAWAASVAPAPAHAMAMGDLYPPPSCNADIASCDVSSATPLSTYVAAAGPDGPVVVPCNACAYVDYASYETVPLPRGLDVVGRLIVPSSANVLLNATAVFVQGILDIEAPAEGNRVTVHLYGTEEVHFYPHDLCKGGYDPGCVHKVNVGVKPFVVAGGQLNINAIDPACPSWTKLQYKVSDDELKVDPAFASCLREGDNLLITSGTSQWNDDHQSSISFVDPVEGVVGLETPIAKVLPGTEKTVIPSCFNGIDRDGKYCCASSCGSCGGSGCSSRPGGPYQCCTSKLTRACEDVYDDVCRHDNTDDLEYADAEYGVEVASLSRAVTFTSTVEDDVGGHLIVFHTALEQRIVGIHFEGFGQSGLIGRYPVHFHMCGASAGSVVSKNVITGSNQRCIVIHNTDEVTVEDNVAHDTLGHCIATETGDERNNKFVGNLAARTRKLHKGNGQSDSPDFVDNTHICASFWVRSAMNEWAGNVAAGSQSQGYWLEMKDKKSNQLFEMAFRDNVAHSNEKQGLTTYRPGWSPAEGAVLFNFKAYKNKFDGLKFHATKNVVVRNGLLADNQYSVRYGAFNKLVTLENTTFDALSTDYKYRLNGGSPTSSLTKRGILAAMNGGVNSGPVANALALHDVTFQNFNDARTMEFYSDDRNYYTEGFGDPVNATGINIVNSWSNSWPYFGCGNKYYHSHLEDTQGKLIAPGEPSSGIPGFIVAANDGMTAFLPDGSCELISYSGGCSYYCKDSCLRSVEVEPKGNGHSYAKMTLTNSDGKSWTMAPNKASEKTFFLVLPAGSYTGQFYDANDVQVLPEWVNVAAHTKPKCSNHVTEDMFTFDTTGTATDYCHKATASGDICCSSECGGKCAGSNCCNLGSGGCDGCCAGRITSSGRVCEHFYDTACIIPE